MLESTLAALPSLFAPLGVLFLFLGVLVGLVGDFAVQLVSFVADGHQIDIHGRFYDTSPLCVRAASGRSARSNIPACLSSHWSSQCCSVRRGSSC
jgi:hypothetical protein